MVSCRNEELIASKNFDIKHFEFKSCSLWEANERINRLYSNDIYLLRKYSLIEQFHTPFVKRYYIKLRF